MCAQGGIFSKKEVRLLVAGLDSAGKTSTRPKLAAMKSFETAAMKEDGLQGLDGRPMCACVCALRRSLSHVCFLAHSNLLQAQARQAEVG